MAKKYWKHIISAIFFAAAFLFWRFGYACAFSYHEQFQMFLFTKSYFMERMSLPGGLADYVSEFLVQFYYYPLFGALIVAALLLGIQLIAYQLIKRLGDPDVAYILSFVPVIFVWHYMGNESVLLSFVVAVLASLGFNFGYVNIKNNVVKMAYSTAGVALFYYLFGAMAFASVLFIIGYNFRQKNSIINSVASVLCSFFTAVICYKLSSYQLYRFFLGVNYFRFPTEIPFMQIVIMLMIGVMGIFNYKPIKYSPILIAICCLVGGGFYAAAGFDVVHYTALEYDYLVRVGNWDKIIAMSENKPLLSPQNVSCINLALAEKGMLGDKMFDYPQNGKQGLMPNFVRDFFLPLSSAEIYLRLGMVNTALRYYFEAQEAIPNYRKSCRITKRLAELNILNEDYDVARKYLNMLSNTLFYKDFAQNNLAFLGDKNKFTENKFWAAIDKNRYQKDFLFSEGESDQMYGLLLVQNEKNRLACDYLMADVLLEKDLQKFINYYPLCKNAGYTVLPKQFQQALIYAYYHTHGNLNGIPPVVTTDNVNDFQQFMQQYSRIPQSVKDTKFEKTYYAYLFNLNER
ncbi:MAG: hypothetical protein II852_14910 [Bacteroidales bacterium]|nr:hypothetical protein [Bacteroidales bacterium]